MKGGHVLAAVWICAVMHFTVSPSFGSSAESANGCHCFKDRSYNPEDRFAADDYILATSFNSLISKSFNISKQQIVMLKMKGGVSQNDLLIGLKASQVTGGDLQQFLDFRKNKESWQKILSRADLVEKATANKVLATILTGRKDYEAGQEVADSLLADFFTIPRELVFKYRSSGLNEKEMSLLFILWRKKGKDPDELASLFQKKGQSWSQIAHDLKVEPAEAGKMILR